jgi:DNA-directed RNA polymerase subunit K/omega
MKLEDLTEKQIGIVKKLRDRYSIHSVIFQRAFETAKNETELFDVLDTIGENFPLIWNNDKNRLVNVDDFFELNKE